MKRVGLSSTNGSSIRTIPSKTSYTVRAYARDPFEEYVGQERVVENLRISIDAAKQRGEPLEHVLFYGPPGLGKTTLAGLIARELGANFRPTSGPTLEKPKDLVGILTALEKGDVFFVDEIHRLSRVVEEFLYPAMEDFQIDFIVDRGAYAKTLKLPLRRFTLVGATTRAGMLTAPLRERFGIVHHLDYYAVGDLERIVASLGERFGRADRLGCRRDDRRTKPRHAAYCEPALTARARFRGGTGERPRYAGDCRGGVAARRRGPARPRSARPRVPAHDRRTVPRRARRNRGDRGDAHRRRGDAGGRRRAILAQRRLRHANGERTARNRTGLSTPRPRRAQRPHRTAFSRALVRRAGFLMLGATLLCERQARAQDDADPATSSRRQALRVLLGRGDATPASQSFTFDGKLYRGTFGRTPDGQIVNVIDLEEYLYSVVSREMPADWPPPALETQAICARTYVLQRSDPRRSYDLVPSELDQLYDGIAGETVSGIAAVDATAGTVLAFGGGFAQIAYSSCCGGHTESSSDAWGNAAIPYLTGVACTYCSGSPNYRWERNLSFDAIASRLQTLAPLTRIDDLRVSARDASGRARAFELVTERGSAIVPGTAFRHAVGSRVLPSLLLTNVRRTADGPAVLIDGCGLGHGVGLCQWGARGMALSGSAASEILAFYFPGTVVHDLT